MLAKVFFISTLLACAQCGFPFNDRPFPKPQFGPPGAPMNFFEPLRPPGIRNAPPPPPPDIRDILRQVPIISNFVRGAEREKLSVVPGAQNYDRRFDSKPRNELDFKPRSKPVEVADTVVSHNEVHRNYLPDSDVPSLTDVTSNSIEELEITSTTEDYETTTDYDLLGRMGSPPSVVASLLG